MLIAAIVATVGWIAFDVAISIMTANVIPPNEWYALVFGGIGLGAVALLGEIFAWMSSVTDRHELLKKIEVANAGQSGKMEVVAILQTLQLRPAQEHPAIMTTATMLPTPTDKKIEKSKNEIKELRKRLNKEFARWPLVSAEQWQELTEAMGFLKGKVSVHIISLCDDYDCIPIVQGIMEACIRAGIGVAKIRAVVDVKPDYGPERGIMIYGSVASSGFAHDLEAAFEDCLPGAWLQTTIIRNNPPPDDSIVIKVGRRWHDKDEAEQSE